MIVKMGFTLEERLSNIKSAVQTGSKEKFIKQDIDDYLKNGGNVPELQKMLVDLKKNPTEIEGLTGGAVQIEKKQKPRIDFRKNRT